MNERLITEALRLDGRILTGKCHVEIVKDFLRAPGDADQKLKQILQMQDGYVTSTGRFVRLDEAALIAKAAGQAMLFGCLFDPTPGIGGCDVNEK